jgi:hypothetical protein
MTTELKPRIELEIFDRQLTHPEMKILEPNELNFELTDDRKQTITPPLEQTPLGFEPNMIIYLN